MSSNLDIHKESAEDITTRMVNKFEEFGGESLGLADERRWLLQAIAYGLFVRNEATNEGFKMNFVRHTKGEFADEIGAFTDTERLPANAASTILRFEIEEAQNSVVAVNPTRVTPGNDLYFVTEYFEFTPGEIIKDVIATCMVVGEVGNGFLTGEINKIVDPFPLFKSVNNLEITQGGAEVETDASLRERIREAPSKFSTAGPVDGYIYWAKTANQDIIDVNAKKTSSGIVRVTPLMTGGELPTSSVLNDVAAACGDDKRRPLTDNVIVNAPDQIGYDIDITYYISNSNVGLVADIQQDINNRVQEYIAWQKNALKRDINPTELNYLIRLGGAKRTVITSPTFKVVNDFEVAKEVNISINYGGIEDD